MTVLQRWHVGPWTTRGTLPGEPLAPGRRRTPDELYFDVIGLARILGRRLSGQEELQVRLWQNELRPTHTRRCGVHTLSDPADAQLLADTAQEALAWLNTHAPAGYEFILTDAVYLRPLLDLTADVVPVEAVLHHATTRSPLSEAAAQLSRLAAAHVRRSATGTWYAGDAVCNWSGPHPTVRAATEAVLAARADLVAHLATTGSPDLAATSTRWPDVPVDATPDAGP